MNQIALATGTPPSEAQVTRVLDLFRQIKDPYQRGKVIGKLEAYVEQAEPRVTAQSDKAS